MYNIYILYIIYIILYILYYILYNYIYKLYIFIISYIYIFVNICNFDFGHVGVCGALFVVNTYFHILYSSSGLGKS